MPESVEDVSFEELRKRFPFMDDLPLKSVYSVFSLPDYYKENNGRYCRYFSNGSDTDTCNLHNLCLRIFNILSILNEKSRDDHIDNRIKLYEHLFYWIYDNIKNSKPCDKLEQLYDELKKLRSTYFPKDKSNVQNFSIKADGFIKKKSLFLHGEILHWIVKAKEKINSKQSTSYYKYLGKCFNFYKKIKCSDNPSIKEEYGNELNTFESNFNIAISTLKEKRVKIRKEEITLPNTAICKLEWENVQETAEVQAGEQGAITDDTESVGLAPLTSIDPNYTTLGSWVNTKILKKDKLMENMKKNNYELFLNDVGNHDVSLNDTMYHISYNSSSNQ
ncbi:PIR protein [Plasmodium vivax]|uniref:VIR protein n=1 Tax=Plasmodium vivax TaxID=5855 RepID=A0A565A582_PLAVI|nr:PIR protein [Plasmodium vivax]